MRYATYTVRIVYPALDDFPTWDANARASFERAISHAEDVVNDALPEGFYCKIDKYGEGVDLDAVRRLEKMGDITITDGEEC